MSDHILRAITSDGLVQAAAISSRDLTERARQIHKTLPVATAALGRTLAAASMMGNALKEEGASVTLQIKGGGPLGTLLAVSDNEGNVRGTVENPAVDLPLRPDGKLDVGTAVGCDGTLTVIRDLNMKEPYVGTIGLFSGEIAEDFAMYYLESEQTPSLCALGTLVGEKIISAGGILIQAMPDCSEELLDALEIRAELFSSISQMLSDMTLEEIVEGCFRGLQPEILEELPLQLRCDCSRDYIERVLLSMGENELRDIIKNQGGCEVQCHFCRKRYAFTKQELEGLIEQAGAQNNE